MDRAEATRLLRQNLPAIRQFGVAGIALFGSVARGEARPGSDIDVLVDFRASPTFYEYMGLLCFLEDLFGTPVDLPDRKALRPEMRASIEAEALAVA